MSCTSSTQINRFCLHSGTTSATSVDGPPPPPTAERHPHGVRPSSLLIFANELVREEYQTCAWLTPRITNVAPFASTTCGTRSPANPPAEPAAHGRASSRVQRARLRLPPEVRLCSFDSDPFPGLRLVARQPRSGSVPAEVRQDGGATWHAFIRGLSANRGSPDARFRGASLGEVDHAHTP